MLIILVRGIFSQEDLTKYAPICIYRIDTAITKQVENSRFRKFRHQI